MFGIILFNNDTFVHHYESYWSSQNKAMQNVFKKKKTAPLTFHGINLFRILFANLNNLEIILIVF
jgi:hypothetical protein